MVGCGLACPGGGGAGVSGCEFRGLGWGWDRRCRDPGARGLGLVGGGGGSWGTIPYGGGGVATRNTGPYIYIYIHTCGKDFKEQQVDHAGDDHIYIYIYTYVYLCIFYRQSQCIYTCVCMKAYIYTYIHVHIALVRQTSRERGTLDISTFQRQPSLFSHSGQA